MKLSVAFCVSFVALMSQVVVAQNLLTNPGFEQGLDGWKTTGLGWRTGGGKDTHSGTNGAVCDVLPTQPATEQWRVIYQNIAAEPGEVFSASCWLKTVSLKSSLSTLEIQFLDASHQVILQFNSPPVQKSGTYAIWRFSNLPAPPRTALISVRGVVNMKAVPAPETPEFHVWDDFELHRLTVTGADKAYLKSVAAETWRSIDALVEPAHGLPYDSTAHAETTSTSNLGFYMTSILAAREFGFIDNSVALAKLRRVIEVLKSLPTWHGFIATWTNVHTLKPRIDTNEHVVSLLDAGNFAASLVTVGQAFPEIAQDCNALVRQMDFRHFYDKASDRLHGGFDIQANDFVKNWWVTDLASDSRLTSFLAVGAGVPASTWKKLNRDATKSHTVSILNPGWKGGGLFMQYIASMFVDERKSLVGQSARNFAFDQMAHQCDVYAPIWGWSACDSPQNGYTNTYGMVPRDNVVTPYASAMAVEDWAPAVVQNFREMESLGSRDSVHMLGFFDSFDTSVNKSSKSFLILDQSMILISLCNYLKGGRIRGFFGSSPLAKNAYSQITDP